MDKHTPEHKKHIPENHTPKHKEFEYDIFISYAFEDSEQARKIYNKLIACGKKVFLSEELLKGRSGVYHEEIGKSLENSKSLLLLWTKNAKASEWVKKEYITFDNEFYSEEKGRNFYIYRPNNVVKLPLMLRRLQIAPSETDLINSIIDGTLDPPPPTIIEKVLNFIKGNVRYLVFFGILLLLPFVCQTAVDNFSEADAFNRKVKLECPVGEKIKCIVRGEEYTGVVSPDSLLELKIPKYKQKNLNVILINLGSESEPDFEEVNMAKLKVRTEAHPKILSRK